jgi:hypothetical protein
MKKEKNMTTSISQLTLTLTLLSSLVIATPLLASEKPSTHAATHQAASDTLVKLVREGNKQYIDVNDATAAGYGPFLGCVAGTDHGAMGVHYVNGTLLGNLTLDPAQPQALIYEPSKGKMTLVGVEFILDSASWLAANDNTLQCSTDRSSISSMPRIASTSRHSLSSTSGRGATTHKAHTSTGTIT